MPVVPVMMMVDINIIKGEKSKKKERKKTKKISMCRKVHFSVNPDLFLFLGYINTRSRAGYPLGLFIYQIKRENIITSVLRCSIE